MGVARHDHACLIHTTPDERRDAIALYMEGGLAHNERLLYLLDQDADSGALEAIARAGVDVEDALDDGALVVKTTDETYVEGGTFDPDRMIALLREAEQEALTDGFAGLRVTGEMTWARPGVPGAERLLEYEARLNEVFPQLRASAICQYDARRFSPDVLAGVLHTHPLLISNGRVAQNARYEARSGSPPRRG